jgi:hypothetical protein
VGTSSRSKARTLDFLVSFAPGFGGMSGYDSHGSFFHMAASMRIGLPAIGDDSGDAVTDYYGLLGNIAL